MKMSKSWWRALGLAALGAVGCAQPVEDQPGATDDHLEMGGRFTSPLSEGIYDADAAMLSVVSWADRQRSELHLMVGDNLVICDATLDISDGAATLDTTECNLKLERGASKDEIKVTGTVRLTAKTSSSVSMKVRRRAADALVGTYTDRYRESGVEVDVHSSTEDKLTYSVKIDGKVVADHLKAETEIQSGVFGFTNGWGTFFRAKTDGCAVGFTLFREESAFGISVRRLEDAKDLATCPEHVGILHPAAGK